MVLAVAKALELRKNETRNSTREVLVKVVSSTSPITLNSGITPRKAPPSIRIYPCTSTRATRVMMTPTIKELRI